MAGKSEEKRLFGRILSKFAAHPEIKAELEKVLAALENIGSKHELGYEQLVEMLSVIEKQKKTVLLPISMFRESSLGILEIIVKFMKEERNLSYHEIAVLLNRDDRTIWAVYNKARKKHPARVKSKKTPVNIPASIFRERSLGTLECITCYMRDELGFSYREIGIMLNRDERNIWTVYNKARKKMSGK